MLGAIVMLGNFIVLHYRGDHNVACGSHAAGARNWCGWRKLFMKNNIQVIYMHTRMAVNGVLK
jgi:hypothetical protein